MQTRDRAAELSGIFRDCTFPVELPAVGSNLKAHEECRFAAPLTQLPTKKANDAPAIADVLRVVKPTALHQSNSH